MLFQSPSGPFISLSWGPHWGLHANAIIDNTDAIVAASTLFVDGQKVARGERDVVEGLVDARLNGFNVEGAECTSYFTKSHFRKFIITPKIFQQP